MSTKTYFSGFVENVGGFTFLVPSDFGLMKQVPKFQSGLVSFMFTFQGVLNSDT